MQTLAQRLQEAEEAYHALTTGRAVAEVRDADGSTIRYSKTEAPLLNTYILSLRAEIARDPAAATPGPMRFSF